jgi:SAM-dependent methyltransferase
MTGAGFHATSCAICGKEGDAIELYPANFHPGAFSPSTFSARRLPDRIHYRMVRCKECGLVRSDPVADAATVSDLYRNSTFDYRGEVENLARTYGAYLARLNRHHANKGSILDIGCGNGFFLEEARSQGYREVRGVEPSRSAIESARPDIQDGIVCSMMQRGLFPEAHFDAVCLFQVLDHMFDPLGILEVCFDILMPGGLVLCVNHNIEAFSARLMKDRSPIIDIEHTYLYSPTTMAALFSRAGFQIKEAGRAVNRYSLGYLMRLVPIPNMLKRPLLAVLNSTGAARLPLRVPLGNLYLIARKPI